MTFIISEKKKKQNFLKDISYPLDLIKNQIDLGSHLVSSYWFGWTSDFMDLSFFNIGAHG